MKEVKEAKEAKEAKENARYASRNSTFDDTPKSVHSFAFIRSAPPAIVRCGRGETNGAPFVEQLATVKLANGATDGDELGSPSTTRSQSPIMVCFSQSKRVPPRSLEESRLINESACSLVAKETDETWR